MSDPKERPADPFGMGQVGDTIVTMTREEAKRLMDERDADEQVDDFLDSLDDTTEESDLEDE